MALGRFSRSRGNRYLAFPLGLVLFAAMAPGASADYVRPGVTEQVELMQDGSKPPDEGYVSGDRSDISADGRFVAFTSFSSLVSRDTNEDPDVYLHDRKRDRLQLVSGGMLGTASVVPPSTFGSSQPTISDDGRFIAFASDAVNLVPSDLNGQDVFVYDRRTKALELASVKFGGGARLQPPV